jgi:UDP-GlcNAc:undecaprenyl-phosphate GlcNAc-1-phosphate transferase
LARQGAVVAAGYLSCRLLLPQVVAVASRRGWMDHPGERRAHTQAVPRLGGVAIMASVAVSLLLAQLLFAGQPDGAVAPLPFGTATPALLLGCAIVFILGVVDDMVGVSPGRKLIGQGVAALVVMVGGFLPQTLAVSPGAFPLPLGTAVGAVVTILWVVGVTNAFNLIDGIDGLAGTMALLALAACVGSEQVIQPGTLDVLSLAFAGALVAFLRSNWHPAKLFLGDSGSMTLGFFLAVRTVEAATAAPGVTYPVVPLVALAYPLVDTLVAMARRWVRGHPFSRADGRHIHHQVLALGFGPPRAVQLLGSVFGGVMVLGVAIVFAPGRLAAALALAGGVLLFAVAVYGVRWLGYVEFLEVGASIASVVRNARTVVNEKLRAAEIAERIGEAGSLEEVRALLDQLAQETRLLDVELLVQDGRERRVGPPSQQLSPPDALPVRLEYPILWQDGDGTREVVLRVWAPRPASGAHPAAERVANRVGPALDAWFRSRGRPHDVLAPAVRATEK